MARDRDGGRGVDGAAGDSGGPSGGRRLRRIGTRCLMPLIGFFALLWFLVRVIPKPSRAAYPCQRVAFPLASSFALWVAAGVTAIVSYRGARRSLADARYRLWFVLLAASAASVWLASSLTTEVGVRADSPVANTPMGEAKGLQPGRVAWVHDPDVTDWSGGTGDGHWWFDHIDRDVAHRMMSRAIRGYAGVDDEALAWDRIFRHFNRARGKGDVGYTPGERFGIKLNLVADFADSSRVDASYEKSTSWKSRIDHTPELVHALLHQLVRVAGVDPSGIWIGDPTGHFPNLLYDELHPDFPEVHYWDARGTLGRTAARFSDHPFYWSKPGLGTVRQDFVPVAYAQAEYVINFALLKSHDLGGITTCGKNHYGSLFRLPTGKYRDASGVWRSAPSNPSYYNYHNDLPGAVRRWGEYRNRVDFMAHDDIGQKTILYLIDAIIAGRNWEGIPEPWTLTPFGASGGWPSSIFVSMDPVAIDSVSYDFLVEQWPQHAGMNGTDDYLIEAALAGDPPSGAFYDPNHAGNVSPGRSLGVHEHWNNPQDKEYSRNLDPDGGAGIELLRVDEDHLVVAETALTPRVDGTIDGLWRQAMWRPLSQVAYPAAGPTPATADCSARFKALWDAGYLYLLVEVTDDALRVTGGDESVYWDDDHVEVLIDADNSKGSGAVLPNYDGLNDFILGFRLGDTSARASAPSVPVPAGVSFFGAEVAGGYRLEIKIPWSQLRAEPGSLPDVQAGTRIGLELRVTDRDAAVGSREATVSWELADDAGLEDVSLLPTVSLGQEVPVAGAIVERGGTWSYLKGTREASDPRGAWRQAAFDDSAWLEGDLPIGYGTEAHELPFATTLADMRDAYTTVFVRRRFRAPEGIEVLGLALLANYDDGFLAWINGIEVARKNVAGDPVYSDTASAGHESGAFERITLPDPRDYLLPADNVLCVEGFNVGDDSSDFKLDLELTYRGRTLVDESERFIRGDSNGDWAVDVSDPVHLLLRLFGGGEPGDCDDAGDSDDNGNLEVTDAIELLDVLFRGAPPLAAPFPAPGRDGTPDDGLGCERS